MTLSIEVLPAPFGPMMARISPLRMSNDTSLIAFTPPNDSETFSTDRSASPTAASRARSAPSCGVLQDRRHRPGLRRPRTFTRAREITPLRPSSKVTSVEMSASVEPSYSALTSGA